jgi:hypothetical protein
MSNDNPHEASKPSEPESSPNERSSRLSLLAFTAALWAFALLIISATPPLVGVFIFPIGLFAFFTLPDGRQEASFAIWSFLWGGWAIYVVLSLWFVATRRSEVRLILGVVFCLLLAFNVGGCAHVWSKLRGL